MINYSLKILSNNEACSIDIVCRDYQNVTLVQILSRMANIEIVFMKDRLWRDLNMKHFANMNFA